MLCNTFATSRKQLIKLIKGKYNKNMFFVALVLFHVLSSQMWLLVTDYIA